MPARKRASAKRGRTVDAEVKGSDLRGVAEDAKRKAHAAGATGRAKGREDGSLPLSPLARQMRDTAIIASLHAGDTTAQVAKEWKISARSVRKIADQFSERRTALDEEPMEIVRRIARIYEGLMRDYAVLAAHAAESQPAVAVAAMRSRQHAMERYVTLLGAVGQLPANLALLPTSARLRSIADQMVDQLAAVVSGDRTAEEALAFFDEMIGATWVVEGEARELPPGEAA